MLFTFELTDLTKFKKLLNIEEVPRWKMQRERAGDFLKWQISNDEKMDIVAGIVCFGIFDK